MHPRHLFLLAATGTLSSCASLTDPIYYEDTEGGTPSYARPQSVSQQTNTVAPQYSSAASNTQAVAEPLPAMPSSFSKLPAATTPAAKYQKRKRDLNTGGPFMQPDVFGIPSDESLREASSSAPSTGNSGLTVPAR